MKLTEVDLLLFGHLQTLRLQLFNHRVAQLRVLPRAARGQSKRQDVTKGQRSDLERPFRGLERLRFRSTYILEDCVRV